MYAIESFWWWGHHQRKSAQKDIPMKMAPEADQEEMVREALIFPISVARPHLEEPLVLR